ncbi:FkbM family methyltransferase [Salinimicrobium gaetbulicola]|uniref:FkbM family methyltransferase n=1 Tax=Salinimicrobium gaetbulicola TaxID=999702 RepID=A0ABW3IIK5_9FLAO
MGIFNRKYLWYKAKFYLDKKSFRGKYFLRRLLMLLKPNIEKGLIVKINSGFKLKIFPLYDKGIERRLFENGIYEKGTLKIFNRIIESGYIIIDAGANIGLMSIHFSRLTGSNGKVFSFEPHPVTFDILKDNININQSTNIYPNQLALGSANKKGEIFERLHINRGAASLVNSDNKNGFPIFIEKLDSYIERKSIKKLNLLKIDVEGYELEVLKGALKSIKKFKPIICLEYSTDVYSQNSPIKIYFLLKELNYLVFKQENGKESESGLIEVKVKEELPQHDNLFCFQAFHLNEFAKDIFVS